jgi:nucleoside phosphorylase/CheY-like chemotaxis protein
MKILLVDDESSKLKKLMRVLTSIGGIKESNITHKLELNSAKRELLDNEFDFLILDLNMPEVLGEDPKKHAGIDFIDEIISVDSYIKPEQIIVLTAFDELETGFKKLTDKLAFPILKYDETSTQWSDLIKSKIRYALLREKNKVRTQIENLYDVAIITAVKTETEAVKKLSTNWEKEEFEGDPTLYYTTQFNTKSRTLKVVSAQQSEMGMSASSALTMKLIYNYKPKYIIMVGIAAGVGSENKYGDVIVPSEVWNYSSGKYVQVDGGKDSLVNFIPDPKSIPLNPKIREIVNQDFGVILYKIKQGWHDAPSNDLNVISGPMACGSAVVANKEIVESLVKSHSRKTVGLDMESYGMFYAAINSNNLNTIPICIKSICDFADSKKGDDYQRYAAYTSANFMKYLVEEQLKF